MKITGHLMTNQAAIAIKISNVLICFCSFEKNIVIEKIKLYFIIK